MNTAEWTVASAITCLSVVLHFIFLRHGGALWRDEAGAINLAEMPSLKEVWGHLYFDSFPVFWVLVARFWWWLGLGSDFGFRVLGFITGLLVLGATWFTAWCLKMRFPFIALILIGLNPLVIVYGDSMRAWGWGLIWITMEFGLLWLVLENPTRPRVIWAIVVGVAAVQSTYFNSVILFVFCSAGVIVALGRRLWKRAALTSGICAVAEITMLPYRNVFRIGQEHYSILRQDFDISQFWEKLSNALSGVEAFSQLTTSLWLWRIPVILGLAIVAVCLFQPQRTNSRPLQREKLLFGALAILMSVPAYFLFLQKLRYVTSPWYYMPLILAIALGMEAIFSVLENWQPARFFRVAAVLALLAAAIPPINGVIKLRMTNMDIIAAQLKESAGTTDLIVVNPFYCGISFARYFSGSAPWLPLPAVDTKFHRYDQVKALIMEEDRKRAIQVILDKARSTLKGGGAVWIVTTTDFDLARQNSKPWAPHHYKNPTLWQAQSVQNYWVLETVWFLQKHSLHNEPIPVPADDPVSNYERGKLIKIIGWRD